MALVWHRTGDMLPEISPVMEGSVRRQSKLILFYVPGRGTRIGVFVSLDPDYLHEGSVEDYFEESAHCHHAPEQVTAWAYFELSEPPAELRT